MKGRASRRRFNILKRVAREMKIEEDVVMEMAVVKRFTNGGTSRFIYVLSSPGRSNSWQGGAHDHLHSLQCWD